MDAEEVEVLVEVEEVRVLEIAEVCFKSPRHEICDTMADEI